MSCLDECLQKYGSANVWKYCCQVFDYMVLGAVRSFHLVVGIFMEWVMVRLLMEGFYVFTVDCHRKSNRSITSGRYNAVKKYLIRAHSVVGFPF